MRECEPEATEGGGRGGAGLRATRTRACAAASRRRCEARARGVQDCGGWAHVVRVDCEQDVSSEGVDLILLVAPPDVGQHGLIRQLDQLAVVRDRRVPLARRQRLRRHVHRAAKRRHAALCCAALRAAVLLLRDYGQGQLTRARPVLPGHRATAVGRASKNMFAVGLASKICRGWFTPSCAGAEISWCILKLLSGRT